MGFSWQEIDKTLDLSCIRVAVYCCIAGNFRESSKKTNFAKKTFANRPKEIL